MTDDLKARLAGAPLIFFDGTVWRDDELIAAGLGSKTGQGMGHIAMSGDAGAIEGLAGLDIGRKIFLHINNSNPALLQRLRGAQDSRTRGLANSRRWNGDHPLNAMTLDGMTAFSLGGSAPLKAPKNWKRRSARSGPCAITICIRFTGCCTAAS